MSTARQMREALQKLQGEVIEIAAESMLEHKEEIIGLLTNQQFEEGIDAEGNPLREYHPSYKQHKILMGRSGKTDLNDTGEFQDSMNMTVNGETFYFESPALTAEGQLKSDVLNEWNEAKGGASVMILDESNTALIYPIIEDTFKGKCNERLSLD